MPGFPGFSRAKPPTIRKVDLTSAEEIVELLDSAKYSTFLLSLTLRKYPLRRFALIWQERQAAGFGSLYVRRTLGPPLFIGHLLM